MSFHHLRAKIHNGLDALFSPPDRLRALALIRAYVSVHLLLRYLFTWPYIDLLYSPNSFIQFAPPSILGIPSALLQDHRILILSLYIGLLLFMLFGIGRRLTVLCVFAFTLILQRLNGYWLDGGDMMTRIILFYLILCDSFQWLSVSRPSDKPGFWRTCRCSAPESAPGA